MKLTAPDGTPLHVQASKVARVNYVSRHVAQLRLTDGRTLLVSGCASRVGPALNSELWQAQSAATEADASGKR